MKSTNRISREPLAEEGVDTSGISVKVLRFEPGASYPYHNHPTDNAVAPAAEFRNQKHNWIRRKKQSAGDYICNPPGF